MLFCSTVFGQQQFYWQPPGPGSFQDQMSISAIIQIDGENPNRSDLEMAAFCNGVVRGSAKSIIWPGADGNTETLVVITIQGNNKDDLKFKLYVPGDGTTEDRILDTDFTIDLDTEYHGSLETLNFYEKHFNVDNEYDLSMTVGATVRIDGVDPKRTDLELAAFCGNEVRGVAKAIYWQSQDMYYYELTVGGRSNGEEITYKLYDPTIADVDLLTDYKTIFEQDATIDDGNGKPVTIEFKNNPVARIGEEGNAARYFSSLEAAVAAAQNDETILLLQDVTLTETLTIEKSITIDGNGFEILPADDSETYNSAIMVGNSGWGDDHGEVITLNNIEFNNWKSNYGVVRAQGVTLNMTACKFNGNDVSNAAYGVLSLNYTDATVTNSIFKQNQDRAIDINYNVGDNSTTNAEVTIVDCIFEENVSDGAGIVVRNKGEKLVVKDSKFLNNTVTTNGNAATIYAGWGTSDVITGCYFDGNNVTTSHATTKRFASAIFCDGCTVTGNAFEANTATRNGETITTTVAVGAYNGAANISENYWGGKAPVPGVDYTVEFTNNNVAINDYYKEYSEGTLSDKVTLNNVAKAGKYYYESITAAFAAVQDGETVTMLHDVNLSESIKVNNNITLDLNGKTITGTDNETGSFALFEIQPSKELIVNDDNNTGKITLTATNNRGWNAYSSVISNQRGKLTINGGTIEHLGGTDMAYAIDNLTNGKGTSAITTIKGGTIESKYIGIRQFLNGVEATNELNITAGSINGENSAIYFQSPSAKANTGKLVITSATPIINNRIYMDVTEGATEWPVEVSIDASALAQGVEIVTSNIPAGYELKEIDGVYSVYHGVAKIGHNYYDDLSSALNAITSGCTLDILTDITIASDWDCRNTGAKIGVPVTINGNGKTIKFTGKIYDANWNTLFRFEDVATVKNLTLDASAATDIQRGITFKTSVTVDNCTLIGNGGSARYAVIVGEGAGAENIGNVTANITNSTFKNWKNGVTDNMNGQDMKEFAITGCTFNNADVVISAKEKVTFTGNDMSSDSYVNITSNTVPNNVQVVANNNTNLAANTETECNQIAAPLANINAQDGFLTPVAEAGGKYYVTLQGAVNGVADSGTITLLSDIELAAQDAQELFKPAYNRESYCGVYIPDDKTVVLELNGKTVSYLDTKDDVDNVMVMNLGNLTINDNSAEKTGKITYKPVAGSSRYAKFYSTIFNCGTLTVNAGTIENTAEAETDVTNAVDNHSRLSHEYGNNSILIVNGGTLSGAYYYAIRQYTHYFEGVQNRVVINDGNINGGIYMQHGDNWYYANAESNRLNVDCYLEIKGGNINVNTTSDAFGKIKSRLNNPDNNAFGLNISGGIINVPVELLVQRGVYYANGVSGTTVSAETPGTRNAEWLAKNDGFVQGGTFSQIGGEEEHTTNLELFLKKGYKLEQNENGTYGVVVDPEYGKQAKIVKDGTTTYYTTIADAITAAQPGETVTILDGEYTADVAINKAIIVEGETDEQGNKLVNITGRVSAYTGATVKNLNVNNTKTGTYDCALNVNGKDIVVDGVNLTGYNAMRYCYASGNITIKNSTINGSNFAVHFDGSAGGNIVFENTDITGWASYASTVNSVSYTDCDFDQGSYSGHRYYNKNISFNECTFNAGLLIDLRASGSNVAFTDEDMTVAEVKALFKDPYYVANGNVTLNGNPVLYAASANSKYYNTLQECIDDLPADGTNWYVTLRSDNVLTAPITIPADKKMTFALNGFDITYTSDVQGEAMITNNGVLTIEGSDDDKVAYKFTGTPDTNYGKGNYTIYNNGTLTVESGIVENTTDAMSHASYAINTGAGATLNIKGGKVLNLNGHAVRMVSFGTNVNNVNITGGYIEGTRALQVQLPGGATSTTKPEMNLSISGGELKSNEETYNLAIYVYSNGQSAENLNVAVAGGTFNGNVAINEVATKTMKEDAVKVTNGTFNGAYGVFSYADNAVAVPVISITGGSFATDYSEAYALDDGYEFVKDETTGRFGLQQLQGLTISTLNELIAFRNAVNAGNDFYGQTVVLSGDVDLAPTRAAENWIPIGTNENPFLGTFDGGNFTISNLTIDAEDASDLGLFGRFNAPAVIKNINIKNVNIKGQSNIGAVVGNGYTGTIDNCHVTGIIKLEGNYKVGGISGQGYAKINNSSVIANEDSESYVKASYSYLKPDLEGDNVGGIVGHTGEGKRDYKNNTVKNILVSGTRKVGGIAGIMHQTANFENNTVENVTVETTATADYANSKLSTMSIGALIGQYYSAGSTNDGTVKECVVKNVTFSNVYNVTVDVGPIVGGARGGTNGMLAPSTDIVSEGNLIYMSTITGSNNLYLMNAVAQIDENKYYTLQDAVDAGDGETINVILSTTEDINIADGATITLTFADDVTLNGYIAPFNGNLTVNGGTINNTNSGKSAIEINAGNLELNNVNISSARHALRLEGINGEVNATINGGTYKAAQGTGTGTYHAINAGGDGSQVTVTITDGTFVGPKGTTADSGSAVNVQSGATVTIEGGDFSGGKNHTLSAAGTLIVKGGTFDQVVKGSYLAEGYVCQMNADNKYEVFFAVAKIGEVNYPSLQEAFNDVDANETITIISNVEESEVILPATLENVIVTASENVVVKNTVIKTPEMGTTSGFAIAYEGLTFNNVNFDNSRVHLTGWANDALSQSVSIKNLVVTNCEFNNIANEENQNYAALHLNVADGVLENLTFTNNKVNVITGGESAALYGNFTGNVTITGNVIRNTSGSSMVVGYSNATINITDNILENWALSGKGRAIRLDVNNEANASTVEVSDNAMIHANAPEEFVKSTGSNTTVTLNENYWYGNSPREEGMVTAAGVVIDNYYETCTVSDDDFVLGNLVVYAKGTITHGYVNTDRIWGEGSSNSQESFVVKVYAGETLLGQASLNDKNNIIDGDIPNVTWGIPYNTANTDEYWTVEWLEALSPSVVPTTVKLYVDGEFVAENTIKMSAPDDLNPIEWEDIFVAKIEEANTYFTSLQAAINAADGKTVVVLDNITLTETVTVAAGTTVTLDLNGKTISAEATFAVKAIVNNGTLTINGNGGTIDISASTTESIQVVDNYGTLTINGGTYKGASSNFSYAIRANHENSVTNIVGATITTYFGAVGINKGVTTITDGKFEVTGAAGGHALYVEGANVTINGGEFIPYPTTVYSYAVLTNDANAKVSITGGTFKKGLGDPCVRALSGNIIITGGTFATDVDDYCHEYYEAVTEDNITWTVEQVLFAQTTELQAGWNWYSSYVDLSTPNGLEKIQTALGTNGEQIKTQGNQFSFYQNNQWISSPGFTSLYNDKMYMIKTTSDVSAEIIGSTIDYANTVIVLNKGWNWISYPLSVSTDVNEALEGMSPADGDIIKGYDDNSTSVYYLSDDPQTPSVWWPAITLEPGQGYMYKSNTNSSFRYTAGDGTSAKANSRDNNYWVSAKSQYANNMTMIAMLSVDNEIVKGDYEIAAFANGECRGSARPIYNEHLDAYVLLLTVYGDEVEELTFKYYDVNYETEYELSNRINYSNDAVVGSIDEPYMFNLDILNIGETSVENISIYPNPTTTGSEINLQAVCDKVEVFNALGVKVAEYTNVDSIDAIETAGVYVIRLTIDNSARNCRLIVK